MHMLHLTWQLKDMAGDRTGMAGLWLREAKGEDGAGEAAVEEALQMPPLQRMARRRAVQLEIVETDNALEASYPETPGFACMQEQAYAQPLGCRLVFDKPAHIQSFRRDSWQVVYKASNMVITINNLVTSCNLSTLA